MAIEPPGALCVAVSPAVPSASRAKAKVLTCSPPTAPDVGTSSSSCREPVVEAKLVPWPRKTACDLTGESPDRNPYLSYTSPPIADPRCVAMTRRRASHAARCASVSRPLRRVFPLQVCSCVTATGLSAPQRGRQTYGLRPPHAAPPRMPAPCQAESCPAAAHAALRHRAWSPPSAAHV